MVAHQTIGMHLKTRFLASFRERLEKILPIHIVMADVFPAISPAHYVINGSRVFASQLAWQLRLSLLQSLQLSMHFQKSYRLTPFSNKLGPKHCRSNRTRYFQGATSM